MNFFSVDMLQMVGALLFVIILIHVVLKKMNQWNQSKAKTITIIDKVPVSRTTAIYIIEVASTYHLMSMSDHHATLIKTLTQDEKQAVQEQINQKKRKLFKSKS